uniref:Uncharacterized protein n=1 Tax=Heterorhabditis bacteriophora TaxID=37862 RepID=A0A1I7WUE4_HETBA
MCIITNVSLYVLLCWVCSFWESNTHTSLNLG